MKIALAGTFAGRGGIQTHLRGLVRALESQGHSIIIISLGKDAKGASKSDVRVFTPSNSERGHAPAWRSAESIVKILREFKPELYLASGTGWNLFLPAWLSRSCKRLIFHEVMSGESSGWNDSRWGARWLFDEVVAQAAPVARNFERTFHWKRPVRVLPAFCESIAPSTAIESSVRRVAKEQVKAAVFSRLVPHKRVLWLVSQWPRLREDLRELHIFGAGPEDDAIALIIKKNRWQDSVFLHGQYPSGQAYADLLRKFDLTLLPTIGGEGAPLVLLESMACGVPFISTNAGGISDYENPDCLIVDKEDPEAFLDAVSIMCKRIVAGEINFERLQAFYRSNFGFEVLRTKWADFVDKTHL